MGFGAITGIEKNPFLKKINGINGIQQGKPVEGVKKTGADGGNPFGQFGDDGHVGLGIKDGATQTSNGQLGKKKGIMHQLGIA